VERRSILVQITECLVDIVDPAIDVPREHLPGTGIGSISVPKGGDISEAIELVAIKLSLQQLQRLDLCTPLQSLGELVLCFGEITVIRIQVLLKDDLTGNMSLGIGKLDAPDLCMTIGLGESPKLLDGTRFLGGRFCLFGSRY